MTAAAMAGAPLLIGIGNGLHPVAGGDVGALLDAVAACRPSQGRGCLCR